MTRPSIATGFAVGFIVLSWSGAAFAGQRSTPAATGQALYVNYCASCHGGQGKGDGPMVPVLNKKPADLTTIARRSGGKFPSDVVFRTIDGRNPVQGHGGQGMPIWGDAFQRIQGGATPEVARARIDALVSYLETIQQK